MTSQLPVFINESAGDGEPEKLSKRLAELFRANGVDARITLAAGDEMAGRIRDAVSTKPRMIVAGGGDGTINGVASAIVGTDIVLGVLALGTLNHFAKDLKVPLELEDAVRVIATGRVVRVDTGEVNDRLFLNNSSLGLYPDIVEDREEQQERHGRSKWIAFARAAATALRRYPFLDVRLLVDGKELRRRTPFVFIGNNEYQMEGLDAGERERLDGGQLSLYVAHRTGRLGLLRLAVRALFGRLEQARDFDIVLAEEFTIETHHAVLRVATDGEVTEMKTPLRYRIRAQSLQVMASNDPETPVVQSPESTRPHS